MPNKSKIKGSNFEREIATILSETYGKSFTRVPHSGSYVGGKNAFRKNILSEEQTKTFKGDIIPPDDWKYFNVECKNYESFSFSSLLTKNATLEKWIDQLEESESPHDFSFIVFKINYAGKFIVFDEFEKESLFFDSLNKIHYHYNNITWIISDFDSFLDKNTASLQRRCSAIFLERKKARYFSEKTPKKMDHGVEYFTYEVDGDYHREDGPAYIDHNYNSWYLKDKEYYFDRWCKILGKTEEEKTMLKLQYNTDSPLMDSIDLSA